MTALEIIQAQGIEAGLTGTGCDRTLDRAIPRESARALRAALEAEGIEASTAPDHDDPSVEWVYVGEHA